MNIRKPRFGPTQLSPGQEARVNQTRQAFEQAAEALEPLQRGASREYSLALTSLEEACMWAVKAICAEDERKPEGPTS